MSKKYIIMHRSDYDDSVHLEFVMDSKQKALNAFRTLYNGQAQYVLFEQIACIDMPAGSRTEADDTSGEASV